MKLKISNHGYTSIDLVVRWLSESELALDIVKNRSGPRLRLETGETITVGAHKRGMRGMLLEFVKGEDDADA